MSVPGRVEAASLLLSLSPPAWLVRHSRAVAEIAGWLALRASERGYSVGRRLVEAAALLHDVDKILPPNDPAASLPHGSGTAAWLASLGFGELSPAVEAHPVTRLRDGDGFDRWLDGATIEEIIVAYADKRAGQRLESLDARFAGWARRYPEASADSRAAAGPGAATAGSGTATARLVRIRADRLATAACTAAGVRADEVRRLRWTGPALRSAVPSSPNGAIPAPATTTGPGHR